MWASSPSTVTSTAPGSRERTTSDRDPCGQHGHAVGLPGHLELDPDGELEVGAGEPEPVPLELEADAGEHRQGTAAVRHGPAGSTEGFDEHVTLGSELHGCSLSPCRSCKKIWWW